ncbi:ATP-grasp domain-containing protein [Salinivibrio costicola]|uniref:ATP-grasp domain-containing protein n=1 Tax=Salinivibrio costicola TaxID=51367 RepID=UPI003F6E4D65
MNKKLRILFTGGGGSGNELIFKQLSKNYELFFADADESTINPTIPSMRAVRIPLASDEEFVERVLSIIHEYNIDLLIPGVDEELPLMRDIKSALPHIDIMVPSHDNVIVMMDKLSLMKKLRDEGIDAPYTTTLEAIDKLSFPFFVKPRWGRGSRGIQTIHSAEDLQQYRMNSVHDDSEIIAQDLMTGTEYTVMMSADRHGNLHAVVPVRVELKKGITIKATTERNELVIDACIKIHDIFNTQGCYNIQVFLQPDGRVLPIEINPRVSTTFCLGISSGVEAIENFYKEESTSSMAHSNSWETGVKLHRHWTNFISKD